MAIPDIKAQAFEELRRAFRNGDVALLEAEDKATGKPTYVICAVNVRPVDDGVEFGYVPFAVLESNLMDRIHAPVEAHHSAGDDA